LASHSYLSNKRALGYLLALVILFSYETPFLVFLAIPLLKKKWDRGLLKDLAVHTLILGSSLLVVIGLRSMAGEGRVGGLSFPDILLVPIQHMLQGPLVNLGLQFYRPYQTIQNLNLEIGAGILIAIPVFWVLISRFSPLNIQNRQPPQTSLGNFFSTIPDPWKDLLQKGITGLLMVILAYPLTFTVRAYAITGRDTRVHAAAVLGMAILIGAIGTALLQYLHKNQQVWIGKLILSCFFALSLGYGIFLQQDYATAWTLQKQFWKELTPLIADAQDGTVILVDPAGLSDAIQIGANTWNLPRTLQQIYHFPDSWKNPPRVYRLNPNWIDAVDSKEVPVQFLLNGVTTSAPDSLYGKVPASNVILIETSTGKMARRSERLPLNEHNVKLKPITGPVLPGMPPGFLFSLLLSQ
jgi:hypothetical protein